jgi:RNA polymerase sigma-70 factor (ECF subfamily)
MSRRVRGVSPKVPSACRNFLAQAVHPFHMPRSGPHRSPAAALADDDATRLGVQAADGDRRAFERLCEALHHDVWRYCWALTGDRHLADEAAQETFLRATTAIRGFRGEAPVRVWLIVLARRSVAATLTGHRRAPSPAEPVVIPVRDGTGYVDLGALIGDLPVDQRQAFVLTQMLGLPYNDAAAVMECPIGTVRSRVFRARNSLIEAWHGNDADESKEACE